MPTANAVWNILEPCACHANKAHTRNVSQAPVGAVAKTARSDNVSTVWPQNSAETPETTKYASRTFAEARVIGGPQGEKEQGHKILRERGAPGTTKAAILLGPPEAENPRATGVRTRPASTRRLPSRLRVPRELPRRRGTGRDGSRRPRTSEACWRPRSRVCAPLRQSWRRSWAP